MEKELTKYEKELEELYIDILPEKIYDAHFHINRRYNKRFKDVGEPFEQYENFMQKYLHGRLSGGMMMPSPTYLSDEEFKDDQNYNLRIAKEQGFDAGLIIRPDDNQKEIEKLLDKNSHIKVLKPYFMFAYGIKYDYQYEERVFESNILDYAPLWVWEMADRRKMPVLVHLGHVQNMLDDDGNIEQIKYICEKYKNAVLVLAHCALGHNLYKFERGIKRLDCYDNLYFDCSGNTEPLVIYHCLKKYGVDRVMFGGDYNFGEDMGRIVSFGSNAIGLHPGYLKDNIPPCYKYQPFNNLIEGLFALAEAGKLLNFTKEDWNKIFYENAVMLYHSR